MNRKLQVVFFRSFFLSLFYYRKPAFFFPFTRKKKRKPKPTERFGGAEGGVVFFSVCLIKPRPKPTDFSVRNRKTEPFYVLGSQSWLRVYPMRPLQHYYLGARGRRSGCAIIWELADVDRGVRQRQRRRLLVSINRSTGNT